MAHEEDNIDTSMVAVVGVISAGISFALIFLLMVLYHSFNNAQMAAEQREPHIEADRLLGAQEAILNDVAWVDENNNQVRIPVSTAMSLVVEQLGETPDDSGVNPPQFAAADATIIDPTSIDATSETAEEPAASEKPAADEPAGEKEASAEEATAVEAKQEEAAQPAEQTPGDETK